MIFKNSCYKKSVIFNINSTTLIKTLNLIYWIKSYFITLNIILVENIYFELKNKNNTILFWIYFINSSWKGIDN